MISLHGISKSFGAFAALHDIDLTVRDGEFLALLGPSGSGKTTLLRIIAGLAFPDAGAVRFNGEDVTELPVAERKVGFVFQQYALFKHMSVLDNVGFGLAVRPRAQRPAKAKIRARARELLDLVQLGGLGDRYPAQLSGGQQQRVALARALAVEPQLLLLDEPFGALDAKVRKELRRWLRQLHDRMGLTSIFVTHDQEEALELADRVVVLDGGRIEQVGTPEEVYMDPLSGFVSGFVGDCNSLPVSVRGDRAEFAGHWVDVPARRLFDGPARLDFRPHDVALRPKGDGVPLQVAAVYRRGGSWRVEGKVEAAGPIIEIDLDADDAPPPIGSELAFTITPRAGLPAERSAMTPGKREHIDRSLAEVHDALLSLSFGSVAITVHEDRVVQIEVTAKKRFKPA